MKNRIKQERQSKEQLDGPSTNSVQHVWTIQTTSPRQCTPSIDWHIFISPVMLLAKTVDGPQKRLSPTGDNLPNVIQYLQESRTFGENHIANVGASDRYG